MEKKIALLATLIMFIPFFLSPCVYAENAQTGGIQIESATYGGNCGAAKGNATAHISKQCNGKSSCRYVVDHKIIGDPAPGCAKTYTVRYRCGDSPQVFEKSLSKEAGWGNKAVILKCNGDIQVESRDRGIQIESATYGGNCGAAKGNATAHISKQCNGKSSCRYVVDHKIIGDPAPGCAKTYTVRYRCGDSPQVFEKSLSKEAGWGNKAVILKCP